MSVVLVVGSSGAGKRTLVQGLLRLLETDGEQRVSLGTSVSSSDGGDIHNSTALAATTIRTPDRRVSIEQADAEFDAYKAFIRTKYYKAEVTLWRQAKASSILALRTVKLEGLEGIVVVFDLREESSLEEAQQWAAFVDHKGEDLAFRLCVGTKLDLLQENDGPVENTPPFGATESPGHGKESEKASTAGAATASVTASQGLQERRRRCLEWCLDHGFEYVEADCLHPEIGRDLREKEGVPRVAEAFQSNVWTGMEFRTDSRPSALAAAGKDRGIHVSGGGGDDEMGTGVVPESNTHTHTHFHTHIHTQRSAFEPMRHLLQFTPHGGTAAGDLILPHAGQQQQQQQQQGVPAGRVPLPRTLRNSPSPPPLGGGNSEGVAWSQGVGVTGGAVCGEPGPGGGGGGGGGGGVIPWDDDYRALRARLEVPSLGFGSLRTPGRGGCFRRERGGGGGAPHGGDSLRSRLCEDLSRFLHIVTERERRTFDAKWVAYQRCRAVVRGRWPRAQVKPYGSFVTGLSLPWSDLDLVICLPKVRRDAPADTPGALEGRNAIKETWQQELARSLGGERWVDNNSLKIISHTAVPVIKLTTVGYPPSCAPSTAFAAATAVAAASASGTTSTSASSAATAGGVGGGIGRTRSPCSPPVGWRGETSVGLGSAASSLPGGPQPTRPPAALEPPPVRAPGDRESAAAAAATAATAATAAVTGDGGVGMGVEDGSGRQQRERAVPAMVPTATSGSTTVVETPSRDEGVSARAAVAADGDERDRGEVSEEEKRGVSSRPERPVPVKAYSSPLPVPPGESTGSGDGNGKCRGDGGNARVAEGTQKKASKKKSSAMSGAVGGQDHGHHQDPNHDRAHRHDRGVDRASSAGAWAVVSGGGGGVGAGAGGGGVDPVGLPRVLVDVSFEGQGHNGQAANQLVKDLVDGFPALRPLALLLKQFMMEKGLCVGYTGGLSSYALTLMVARYLQEQTSQMDSGSLLLGFLDFYGNHFDPRRTGISVRRSRYFSRSAPLPPPPLGPPPVPTRMFYGQRGRPPPFQGGLGGTAPPGAPPVGGIPAWGDMMRMPYRFDPLFIEDPMNLSNNVGRNCFRVNQIQRAWSDAHASLTRALDDESQLRSNPSPYRLLRCIISDPEPAPYT